MPSISVTTNVKEASLSAVVTRCGCSDRQKSSVDWHGARGVKCPNPARVEDHGVVAYYHRNPLRRLAWRISRLIQGEVR